MNIRKLLIRKTNSVIKKPNSLLITPLKKLSFLFNDEFYLKALYRLEIKKKLNLKNPVTYNEKLQWLKINFRKPELTKMVDKYESKRYVADLIGEKYIIPTLGVWNNFEDIDFDTLPNQFVLKTTHDSGGVVICKDKSAFDFKSAKRMLDKCLKQDYHLISREWPYKNIKPRVIAEKYMIEVSKEDLYDYKFFCFDGIPKALFVATERQSGNVKFDYFDMNFNHLDFVQSHEHSNEEVLKPDSFDKMVELSKLLSNGLPHVRVDFYDINGEIYFGELTLFHHGGLVPFYPEEWDYQFGSWLDLPIPCNTVSNKNKFWR